ncbi:unnamed protein product [Prunus armeniaca]|uniref:Uncharacterized protein n=1 Tax=Prunus armeniaca TaxID=36596 RepID=A0A6J5U3D0_PRUAR|nr:unnamed protein product [Prunus armeniaca]
MGNGSNGQEDGLIIVMAVRSVLGKLGRSRFIPNNGRLIMVGSSPTVCSSPHHPFDYYGVVHDQNKADKKSNPFLLGSLMKEPVYCHLDFGGQGPVRFAIEELRKKRNIQLQSVRVLRVLAWKDVGLPRYDSDYDLLLEAVDADVMRYFEVTVSVNSRDGLWLEDFCLLVDNKKPIRLYHHLDNFFDANAKAREQLSFGMRKGNLSLLPPSALPHLSYTNPGHKEETTTPKRRYSYQLCLLSSYFWVSTVQRVERMHVKRRNTSVQLPVYLKSTPNLMSGQREGSLRRLEERGTMRALEVSGIMFIYLSSKCVDEGIAVSTREKLTTINLENYPCVWFSAT